MPTAPVPPIPLAGEIASLGAAMIWAVSLSIFTQHGKNLPATALNLYKNLVAVVFLLMMTVLVAPDMPKDPWVYIKLGLSGVIGLSLGDTALFAALKRLGAQVTSASQCLAPPLAAFIALMFLGETLSPFESIGMIVTVTAVAAIIVARRPANGGKAERVELWKGATFAVLSASCQAVGLVLARDALQDVHVTLGTLLRIVPALVVLTGLQRIQSRDGISFSEIFASRTRALVLGFAAFLGTFLGVMLMSAGAKYAKAGIVGALTSTYPVWIIPIAKFVLKESVTWRSVVYTLMAVVGIGLMVA